MSKNPAASKRANGRPLRLEWIEAGQLDDNPANWRKHPPSQLELRHDTPEEPVDLLAQRIVGPHRETRQQHQRLALVGDQDLEQHLALARVAPEHLEICTSRPEALVPLIRHAGAIFLGAHTPEAIGDYVGGPNHVLPTSGSARFSSGLSVLNFMKRTTIARLSPEALAAIGPAAETLAISEGLEAHGLSVRRRLDALETRGEKKP